MCLKASAYELGLLSIFFLCSADFGPLLATRPGISPATVQTLLCSALVSTKIPAYPIMGCHLLIGYDLVRWGTSGNALWWDGSCTASNGYRRVQT